MHYVVSVTVSRVDTERTSGTITSPSKNDRVVTEISRVTHKAAGLNGAIDYVEAVLELSRNQDDSFTDPEPRGNTRDR